MNTDKVDTENKALHLTDLLAEVICPHCNGVGWYEDHSDKHYHAGDRLTCEQAGCPIQVRCENCQETGKITQKPEGK